MSINSLMCVVLKCGNDLVVIVHVVRQLDFLQIREEKEFENLAKLYITELIKKECWDEMEVKGRGIEVSEQI